MIKNCVLICRNNGVDGLTKGKSYTVIDTRDFGYVVINDKGESQLVTFEQIAINCRVVKFHDIHERFWEVD